MTRVGMDSGFPPIDPGTIVAGKLRIVRLLGSTHHLLVERGGFRPTERDVDIGAGQTAVIPIVLDPTPEMRELYVGRARSQRTWSWIAIGGGLAIAGGGTAFLILNSSAKSDARADYDAAVGRLQREEGVCDTRSTTGDAKACPEVRRRPEQRRSRGRWCLLRLSAAVGAATAALSACACRSTPLNETSPAADASPPPSFEAAAPALPALIIDNRGPGQFLLRVNESIKLSTTAIIEHQSGDGPWTLETGLDGGRGYRLVSSCDEKDVGPCRTFGAGALFMPEPWSGYDCTSQCNGSCDKNVLLSGTFRLVVSACDDPKRRYEGQPFEIPSDEASLLRRLAASSLTSATACRLETKGAQDPAAPASPDRRAGFKVMPGSESALEVDGRSELAKWLRGRDHFKDGDKKGCARKNMVGFLLKSRDESGQEATAEIAIDFACNTFTLVRERSGARRSSSSIFDPSRSVILGIASRALPKDAELNRLQ